MLPAVLKASASSGDGAGAVGGLVGSLCRGGAGPCSLSFVPLVLGVSKAPGILVCGGGAEAPFGDSESISIGVGSDMVDKTDNLCSGGQFRGCSLGSIRSREEGRPVFRELR